MLSFVAFVTVTVIATVYGQCDMTAYQCETTAGSDGVVACASGVTDPGTGDYNCDGSGVGLTDLDCTNFANQCSACCTVQKLLDDNSQSYTPNQIWGSVCSTGRCETPAPVTPAPVGGTPSPVTPAPTYQCASYDCVVGCDDADKTNSWFCDASGDPYNADCINQDSECSACCLSELVAGVANEEQSIFTATQQNVFEGQKCKMGSCPAIDIAAVCSECDESDTSTSNDYCCIDITSIDSTTYAWTDRLFTSEACKNAGKTDNDYCFLTTNLLGLSCVSNEFTSVKDLCPTPSPVDATPSPTEDVGGTPSPVTPSPTEEPNCDNSQAITLDCPDCGECDDDAWYIEIEIEFKSCRIKMYQNKRTEMFVDAVKCVWNELSDEDTAWALVNAVDDICILGSFVEQLVDEIDDTESENPQFKVDWEFKFCGDAETMEDTYDQIINLGQAVAEALQPCHEALAEAWDEIGYRCVKEYGFSMKLYNAEDEVVTEINVGSNAIMYGIKLPIILIIAFLSFIY